MVLIDKALHPLMQQYKNNSLAQVNPASIDLTLGNDAIIFDWPWPYRLLWYITGHQNFAVRERKTDIRKGYWLRPGKMALLHSQEHVIVPSNTAAVLTLKSSRGREGFNHAFAGWFDPGFEGQAVFAVYASIRPLHIQSGMRFAQLIYFQTHDVPQKDYSVVGHYQRQEGPVKSKA